MKTTKVGIKPVPWYLGLTLVCCSCAWEGHLEAGDSLMEHDALIIDNTPHGGGRSVAVDCPYCGFSASWDQPAPTRPSTLRAISTHPRFAELESEQAEAFFQD